MLKLNEKIMLNQFIGKMGVCYDEAVASYRTSNGAIVSDITKYIENTFKNQFKRFPKKNELSYIQDWLLVKYDFENIPYMTYVKTLQERAAAPKEFNDLRDRYNNYLESIQNKMNSKQCIYIAGASGDGKTTYAKILAMKHFSEDDIYISSGGDNPFDEYFGQKCIIIDDFRDNYLKYSDLLKLLDNHTTSNVGARYHNKSLARCELIILTSVKSPIDLYQNVKEDKYQLFRRINYLQLVQGKLLLKVFNRKDLCYEVVDETSVKEEIDEYIFKNAKEQKDFVMNIFNKPFDFD